MSWPLAKLETVSEFIRNGASIKQSSDAAGLPITRIETIADRAVNLDKCGYADVSEGEYLNYRLCNGDILISHINSEKHLAKCAIFESDRRDIVHGMNLLCLRPRCEVVFPKYLFHYLSSPVFLRLIPAITKKSVNQASFTVTAFKDLEIPLPPLPVQKRIAAILDKADAIRRKRKQAIQLADDFLRAVFLDMFGDPVTNPKGWETFALRELIHLQGGYAFKSDDFSDVGIPVVKIGNANKVGFTTKNISFIQPESLEKLVQYELYPGDLLISLTGTVGKDDYANVTEVTDDYERYYLNQRVAKIAIRSEWLTKNYLRLFLAHPKIKSEITKASRGVRQANISNGDIYELHIPLPEHDALVKFDHVIERLNSAAKALSQCSRSDGALFHSLSQKAFSGQL